ncbi:efflux RND transporter permease subunit [Thalassomonas haliotis]|uniref:Efflux RND transporter permease subunit n=1 Tax=Thalassomonas haliotis TaxID=485448 RepID=A0ABY7VHT9_9GAMM|nr:efflux RND transporter permease subunit [Thalassomonas haliotis]WDE13065.1 efflux RND transporter permease subunit [Thalassomonas haliotis]
MHFLTNWFTKNPVAANLLMALILIAGYLSFSGLRIEGFPKIAPNSVTISVDYPGASPEQFDIGVSRKIEQALEGLPGIKRSASFSSDSFGFVRVEKESGYDFNRFVEDIKTRIDTIHSLPKIAEKPLISRDEFDFPALIVQVYGETDIDVLQKISRRVKDELLAQPEITKLKQWGQRSREISIKVSPAQLERFDLSLSQVGEKINQHSLLYPGGLLRTQGGNIRVRGDQLAVNFQDYAQLPLKDLPDGSRLLLKDVATIEDGFIEGDGQVRYQGQPAIGMELIIDRKGNLLTVSKVANKVIAQIRRELPAKVKLDIWANQSNYISDRLNLLKTNAIQGLMLVFILLALFLNVKLAFWVAAGIPVAVAGTFALMGLDAIDYSVNDITTFGMIIVLGILVDDAVVVGESVYSEREKIKDTSRQAAITGTQQGVAKVSTATVFGVMTTIAAFYPMLLIDNALGKVLASFAGVVIIALLFSLVESKLILPAHLAQVSVQNGNGEHLVARLWHRLQNGMNKGLDYVNLKLYKPLLAKLLHYRYATLIGFFTFALFAIGMISNGSIKTAFFPDIPGSLINVTMEMDQRSPYRLTVKNAGYIEKQADVLNQQLMAEFDLPLPPIARVMTAINDSSSMEIYAELLPEAQRGAGTVEIVNRWRELTGQLEGTDLLNFTGSESTGGGFAIRVSSPYQDELEQAVAQITQSLTGINGVNDVRDDLKGGAAEIFVRLKPGARALGLSTAMIASQIGDGYGGLEVQRLQRGSNEVKVKVKFDDQARNSVDALRFSRIQTTSGNWVPLIAVAELESKYTPAVLWRRNGKRSALISANIDKSQVNAMEVLAHVKSGVQAQLEQQFAGIEIAGAGELEEEGEIRSGLVKALILTLVLIYALLAVPLKSYWQPLVIMSVIPFGFAGAAIGHLIAGIEISLLSFFGMLALAGIVVNDSLVMLTRYNQMLEQGMPAREALVAAGSSRFRAIFLTTVTTVAGLMPLLSETSEQAQYLIPAAVSLAYGELFATAITLIAVPVVLSIFSDIGVKKADKAGSSTDKLPQVVKPVYVRANN